MPNSKMISIYRKLIENVFITNGFKQVFINGYANFKHEESYRKITYVQSLGFVIEYAQSYDDAMKNLYEDGDCYPLSLGESIPVHLQADVEKYMV